MSSNKRKKKNLNNPAGKTQKGKTALGKPVYLPKRKIPLNILLSLTAPLTVCFFGPFETYCGNMSEFVFSLGDFLPLCLLAGLLISGVLFGILQLLDGRAYDITCAVILWFSVMPFVQKYYLNMGVNALAGDGVGTAAVSVGARILNAGIWLAVGALILIGYILLKKKNVAPFFVSCAALLIVILATELVGFGALSFTTDVYVPVTERIEGETGEEEGPQEPAMLTYKNLDKLSEKNNVIFFLIDRFDVRYFEDLQKKDPDLVAKLDGFTFYNDYTSLYCRTYPAVSSILTGMENDFTDTRLNYFKKIYTDGGYMRQLHEKGYKINVYTDKYYSYDNAAYMSDYAANLSGTNGYAIANKWGLCADMLRLSLSTYLPLSAKGAVGDMSTPDFNAHAVYESDEPVYDTDMKNLYDYIKENQFTSESADGQFSFIHMSGCHTPIKYNLNWEEADDSEKYNTGMALKQSLTIIYEYIEEMKRLGVYEDATIIITGDHPAAISDTKLIGEAGSGDNGTRVTAMLFKESGSSGTPLKTSKAQISQAELWNTIYQSEGLTDLIKGDSFFDISEDEERVRKYLFEMSVYIGDDRADEIVEYRITGSARNRENWKIAKRTVVGRIYK